MAITRLGSAFHYQLAQIARAKKFDFKSMALKPLQTIDDMARARRHRQGRCRDPAGAPMRANCYWRDQAKLVGWYSEIGEQQFGALFAIAKTIASKRRAIVEKFVRAYRRGAADYAPMVQLDRGGKRVANVADARDRHRHRALCLSGRPLGEAATTVEAGGFSMDPQARLDLADIARQIDWFKEQGLIDKTVEARQYRRSSQLSAK